MRPCGLTDGSFTNLNIFSVMESNWNFPQLTADKNKEIFLSTVARITKIIGQTLTGKQQPSVMSCAVAAAAGGEWTLGRPSSRGQCCDVPDSGAADRAVSRAARPQIPQHNALRTRTIVLF